MDRRTQHLFLALIGAQVMHSLEEFAFRLFDVFAPVRFLSGLVSADRALGFAAINVGICLFGFWCWFAWVRRRAPSAAVWMWGWSLVELTNGTGHLVFAALRGGYFPGAATAPLLLALSATLLYRLARPDEAKSLASTGRLPHLR